MRTISMFKKETPQPGDGVLLMTEHRSASPIYAANLSRISSLCANLLAGYGGHTHNASPPHLFVTFTLTLARRYQSPYSVNQHICASYKPKMQAGSLILMFFFGALFILWLIFSIHARERITTARSLGVRLTAAQNVVKWTLAIPSVLVLCALQGTEYLGQALRYIGILIRSLCKAVIRAYARKWQHRRHRRHTTLSTRNNDLEMSRGPNRTLFEHSSHSLLLQVPAEIREIIIRMSLVHYDVLDCRPTILLRPRKQFRNAMAFIRTCRQIYQEGHPIVFGSTLFHIWTRSPFHRQLKPVVWNEFTMIHLAAQLNSKLTSRIGAAIRDLNHMLCLRDLYISIWDFVDFENNKNAIAGVFGPLRIRLKDLSLVQVNLVCPRAVNPRAERHLKTLIIAAKRIWPVGREFGILSTLQGPVTKWRAFIKLQGYETRREVGVDEDLVALPWDGEHF